MSRRKPAPPSTLGTAGKRLWRDMVGEYDLDRREREILTRAAELADLAAELAKAIGGDAMIVAGSKGQARVHPAVAERRQSLASCGRLLGQLGTANRWWDE